MSHQKAVPWPREKFEPRLEAFIRQATPYMLEVQERLIARGLTALRAAVLSWTWEQEEACPRGFLLVTDSGRARRSSSRAYSRSYGWKIACSRGHRAVLSDRSGGRKFSIRRSWNWSWGLWYVTTRKH